MAKGQKLHGDQCEVLSLLHFVLGVCLPFDACGTPTDLKYITMTKAGSVITMWAKKVKRKRNIKFCTAVSGNNCLYQQVLVMQKEKLKPALRIMEVTSIKM